MSCGVGHRLTLALKKQKQKQNSYSGFISGFQFSRSLAHVYTEGKHAFCLGLCSRVQGTPPCPPPRLLLHSFQESRLCVQQSGGAVPHAEAKGHEKSLLGSLTGSWEMSLCNFCPSAIVRWRCSFYELSIFLVSFPRDAFLLNLLHVSYFSLTFLSPPPSPLVFWGLGCFFIFYTKGKEGCPHCWQKGQPPQFLSPLPLCSPHPGGRDPGSSTHLLQGSD